MRIKTITSLCAALVASLAVVSTAPAETLGEVLRDSGWDKIVGTWIDADTEGATIKTTYKWRLKDHVLDVETRTAETESVGLIAVSGQSGEVVHVGADNQGGSAIGKWGEDDGDAVLELAYVTADGDEGEMRIRHHLKDDDTMVLTIETGADPITLTMVRVK